MKLITFVIPSYNSEEYLHYALDSLIPGGEDIEVLVIDDGSKDNTLKIAKEYETKYPNIFKAIHQENKGHGGVINNGIKLATGKYFKVLDSDDWVDTDALKTILSFIKENDEPDLILANYTYYQGRENRGKTIRYKHFIQENKVITFNEVKRLPLQDNITLHSAIYKTEIIRKAKVELPEHMSYEDNLFVYYPMPFVNKLIYFDVSLYSYLIGRAGQSMEQKNLVKKYKDFIYCGNKIFNLYDITKYKKTNKGLYRIMMHHLVLNCILAVIHSRMNNTKEAKANLKKYMQDLKLSNKKQFRKVRRSFQFWCMSRPTIFGYLQMRFNLWLAHKVVKYN